MESPESRLLMKLAQDVCHQATGIEDAIEDLESRVRNASARERRQLIDEAISWACREAIYDVRHVDRRKLKRGDPATVPGHCDRKPGAMNAVNTAIAEGILDRWSMDDGRPIGDWTGEELKTAAQTCRAHEAGWRKVASFYETLAKTAGQRRVRDAMGDAKAHKIWDRIYRSE